MDGKVTAQEKLVLALPKGRILDEAMPLVRAAGIEPEADFDNPEVPSPALQDQPSPYRHHSRARFRCGDLRRLWRGAYRHRRQRRADGIRLSGNLCAAGSGHRQMPHRRGRARSIWPAPTTRSRWSHVRVATKYPAITTQHFAAARRAGRMHQAERRHGTGAQPGPVPPDRRSGFHRLDP